MVRILRIIEDPEQPNIKPWSTSSENLQSWKRLHWCHSQLDTVSDMASLMAFFSITAAVELQIKEGAAGPGLIIAFVTTTCLLVGITVIVKIISASVLPHIECIADTMAISDVHRSPHDQIFSLIRLTCVMGHTLAPFLFCMDLILIAWIKFAHLAIEAPLAVMAIMIPIQIVILIFGRVKYKTMMEFSDKQGVHLLPNRRYSEIAEAWDDEDEDESSVSEDSAFLLNSYSSTTSYGAIVRHNCNLSPMKIFVDCMH